VSAALTWTRSRPLGVFLAVGLAAAALARFGLGAAGLIAAFTCAVLVVLSIIDFESRRLPDRIVLPSAALVLAARLVTAPEHWGAWLGASLGAAACFLVLALVSSGGLGMGDVKLMLLLGAALGGAITSALVIGTLAGAAAALVLIARDGRRALRRRIAYGPFLAFGAIAVLLLLSP
jgi:prepilin signal peptidase PulO-like enzyme (type II secretory pathway)